MSVIVKGIKMPDCCEHCYLEHFGICTPTRSTVSIPDLNKKLDNCPLVELPERHGRLIDADTLRITSPSDIYVRDFLADAPAVLEAE